MAATTKPKPTVKTRNIGVGLPSKSGAGDDDDLVGTTPPTAISAACEDLANCRADVNRLHPQLGTATSKHRESHLHGHLSRHRPPAMKHSSSYAQCRHLNVTK